MSCSALRAFSATALASAAWRIKALTECGCAVLHIAFKDGYGPYPIPGATFLALDNPATAPDAIAKAAIEAIAATR